MYAFLIVIIILLILDKIIDTYFYNVSSFNDNYYKYFSRKTYLLTPTELKFYYLLKQITDKLNLNLFCQVSMY